MFGNFSLDEFSCFLEKLRFDFSFCLEEWMFGNRILKPLISENFLEKHVRTENCLR